MKKFIYHLFSIYPGEEKSALLFSLLGFLWAFTISSAVKFADASFIIHVGAEALPTVYILTGSLTIGLALFFMNAYQTIDTHKIFIAILSVCLCFYTFASFSLWTGFGQDTPYIWFALRVVGYVSLTVILTCFWTFVDHYHHIQDAKRRYSLFTSSIFFGIATTGVIMRTGAVSFQAMTLFILIGLALTIFWICLIHKTLIPVHNEHEHEGLSSQEEHSLSSLFRSILSSPFTMFIMAGSFLTYLLLSNTEYNYMSSYEEHFAAFTVGSDNPELTQFLGKVVAGISVVSIALGLFLYPQVIRRFGVTSFLLFTPALLLITFFGWSFSDMLFFPILGNFLDEGAVYVIEDSNLNLMLNGVPSKVKYKIRLFIESFFEPFGALLSGILLSMPFVNSKALGLFLAAVAFCVALGLRKRYLQAIYSNLAENAIHFDRPLCDWFSPMKEKAEHRLLAILKGDPEFALSGLMQFNDPHLLAELLKLLDQQAAYSKMKFIEFLPSTSFALDPEVLEHLNRWAEEEEMKGFVHLYLAKNGLSAPENLTHPDLSYRGGALIALKQQNPSLAREHTKKMLASKNKEEICMALQIMGCRSSPEEFALLIEYIRHPNLAIARSAASAVLNGVDKNSLAKPLITQLKAATDHELRILLLKALAKIGDISTVVPILLASIHFRPGERRFTEQLIYQMGSAACPQLLTIAKDVNQESRCRVLAGKALGRISLPLLRDNLSEIISIEKERAFFYFYHHHALPTDHENHDLAILKESLLSSYHSVLNFIIQLLGVAGELEDCELLARLIRSEHPKLRSQVIEALEKSCDIKVFRMIEPLINELPISEKLHQYTKLGYPVYTVTELLTKLSYSPLELDQVIAAAFMHRLKVPEWEESLRRQVGKKENLFNHFAFELLEA